MQSRIIRCLTPICADFDFRRKDMRRKGDPQPFYRKFFGGFCSVMGVLAALFLPLFIFSDFGSPLNVPRRVKSASLEVGPRGVPPFYVAPYATVLPTESAFLSENGRCNDGFPYSSSSCVLENSNLIGAC